MKNFYIIALLLLGISNQAMASTKKAIPNKAPASTPVKSVSYSSITSNIDCAAESPCSVIKTTSEKLIGSVNRTTSASAQKTMPLSQSMQSIQSLVAPQFDFALMTKLAVGANWKQATSDQQHQLVTLFKQLLIYTYSAALSKSEGGRVVITDQTLDDTNQASVVTEMYPYQSADNQPIKVEYVLAKTGKNHSWKIFDVKIENASLVTSYRNQFNDIIENSKVEGLIQQLKTKVHSLEQPQG